MKKMIAAFVILVILQVPVFSQSLELVLNGAPGGTWHKRTMMYAEQLEILGYDVTVRDLRTSKNGAKFFSESQTPTIMVWGTANSLVNDFLVSEEIFVMTEYIIPYFVCATNEGLTKSNINFGHGKQHNPEWFIDVIKTGKKNIRSLPYENSSAIIKAILGGDIDYMMNNQSSAKKFISSGKGVCLFNTSAETVIGVPSVLTMYKEKGPVQIQHVLAKNIDPEKVRKILKPITEKDPFKSWHKSNEFLLPDAGTDRMTEAKSVIDGQYDWKPWSSKKLQWWR